MTQYRRGQGYAEQEAGILGGDPGKQLPRGANGSQMRGSFLAFLEATEVS